MTVSQDAPNSAQVTVVNGVNPLVFNIIRFFWSVLGHRYAEAERLISATHTHSLMGQQKMTQAHGNSNNHQCSSPRRDERSSVEATPQRPASKQASLLADLAKSSDSGKELVPSKGRSRHYQCQSLSCCSCVVVVVVVNEKERRLCSEWYNRGLSTTLAKSR